MKEFYTNTKTGQEESLLEEKKEQFIYSTECRMGEKGYDEWETAHFFIRIFVTETVLFLLVIVSALAVLIWEREYQLLQINSGWFCAVGIVLYVVLRIRSRRGFRRLMLASGKEKLEETIHFYPDHFEDINDRRTRSYGYHQIRSVYESHHYFILNLDYELCLLIDKGSISGGTQDEFVSFLLSQCGNLKKKKIYRSKYRKKVCIILFLLTAVLCVITTIYGILNPVVIYHI
jgi:hypothetical protein